MVIRVSDLMYVFGNIMYEKFWNNGAWIKISRNKEKGQQLESHMENGKKCLLKYTQRDLQGSIGQ